MVNFYNDIFNSLSDFEKDLVLLAFIFEMRCFFREIRECRNLEGSGDDEK